MALAQRDQGIPAIVRTDGKVRGGTLHFDPLSTIGYRFEYVAEPEHANGRRTVRVVTHAFDIVYMYQPEQLGPPRIETGA